MPYRAEQGALRARRLSLESEIEALEQRAHEVPYLEHRKRELQRELAALPDPDAKEGLVPRNQRRRVWVAGALATTVVVCGGVAILVHRVHDETANVLEKESTVASQPTSGDPDAAEAAFLGALADDTSPSLPVKSTDAAFGISLDFAGSGTAIADNEIAGIAPLAHWNALSGANGSNASLGDAFGAAVTETQVSWHSGDGWVDGSPENADGRMISGSIEQNGSPDVPGTVVVLVTNLPRDLVAGKYAVVVYSDKIRNPEDQVTRVEATAGAVHQTFYLRDPANHDYPLRGGTRGYVAATGTRDERMATPISNCAIFTNLSARNLEVRTTTGHRTSNNTGGCLRSPINGMQILPMAALSKIGVTGGGR
jgi:hypothetical protein